jgi:hypothetical protein
VADLVDADLLINTEPVCTESVNVGLQTNLIAHRLMTTPPPANVMPQDSIFKALRLGAILCLISIKRAGGSFPGECEEYVSCLLDLLSAQPVEAGTSALLGRLAIRSWLLFICYMSSSGHAQRTATLGLIDLEMRRQGLEYNQLMEWTRQLPWPTIFDVHCTTLGQQVNQTSITEHTKYQHLPQRPM